jgi:hypothetical protein
MAHHIRATGQAATLAAALLIAGPALADGKVEIRYDISVVGLTVGKGSLTIDLNDTTYTATASGRVSGAASAVTSGEGSAAARGALSGARLTPQTYALQSTSRRRGSDVKLTMGGGTVREYTAEPPPTPASDRVPINEEHLRGVLDPLSAAVVILPGRGPLVGPDACNRTVSVFDGRSRFDLALSFKRIETVKAERGYAGETAVCAVRYSPVAGHRQGARGARLLAQSRDIEVWLAPIEGTRALAPFKVLLPTSLGQATMVATQFLATADAKRADVPAR